MVYTVTNVTDGDTVDISSTDGQVFTVRVLGIDAPEIGTGCAADLATETMTNLVLGREVALTMGADGEDVDQYGRFLRFVEVDGTDVGLALLSYGLASARHDSSDGYANHGREAQYHSADDSSIDYSCAPPPAAPAPSAPSAAVYYANCDDVRAHDAAPIHPGDPGWREAFDRDGDGIGCEVATATNPSTRRPCASCAAAHLHGVRGRGRRHRRHRRQRRYGVPRAGHRHRRCRDGHL